MIGNHQPPAFTAALFTLGWRDGHNRAMLGMHMAAALGARHKQTGFLDLNSVQPLRAMAANARPIIDTQERIEPCLVNGIQFVSIAQFLPESALVRLKPESVSRMCMHLLKLVNWHELSCLLINVPDGFGELHSSLLETVAPAQALLVTTPGDPPPETCANLTETLERRGVPVLGVVENHFDAGAGALSACAAAVGQYPVLARFTRENAPELAVGSPGSSGGTAVPVTERAVDALISRLGW